MERLHEELGEARGAASAASAAAEQASQQLSEQLMAPERLAEAQARLKRYKPSEDGRVQEELRLEAAGLLDEAQQRRIPIPNSAVNIMLLRPPWTKK